MSHSIVAGRVPPVNLASFEVLLAQLVACESISSPLATWDQSNATVISLLSDWFSNLGFRTEMMEIPGNPGKFNLIATLGQGAHGLILAGHTDTVPFDANKWHSDPFKMNYADERFYGLGTCDMKGFFAIIIEALKALEGAELSQPLIIVATADEESSMSGARALAKRGADLSARAAVIGEPTSIKPIRMHKGIMMEKITVTGRSGHSSNPSLGLNALEGMHDVMTELMRYRESLAKRYQNPSFTVSTPTMNLGHIHGGDSPNRICGKAQLSFDVRLLPGMNSLEVRQEIEAHTLSCIESRGYELSLEPLIEHVDPFETPVDAHLVSICEALTGVQSGSVAFATEAPFLSGMGIDTIVLGAGSIDQAHQPNEFLHASQIEPMAGVLASLIKEYCVDTEGALRA